MAHPADEPALDADELGAGLPPPPPAELDDVLDAASDCFARHGISRTRVPDIAAQLGVSRVTVYRRAGNVAAIARLLLARELHRLVEQLPAAMAGAAGPQVVVRVAEVALEQALSHPVLIKVITDDTEVIGPLLASAMPTVIERGIDGVAPLLEAAAARGDIVVTDARALAEWLVRLSITCALAPPAGEIGDLIEPVLLPALSTEAPR